MTRYSNGQPLGVGGGYPDPSDAGDYLRGDRTWADLNKAAVGLSNVDNTSDANKPISSATQSALDAKVTGAGGNASATVVTATGGSSSRSLAAWLGDVKNVKSAGALGDGSTDDATAIQNAINAAATAGGVVYFPPGVYMIGTVLTVPSNIELRGDGKGASVIKAAAGLSASTAMIRNATTGSYANSNITFRGLTFDGNGLGITGTQVRFFALLDFARVTDFTMSDCCVRNYGYIGLAHNGLAGGWMVDNEFDTLGFDGTTANGGSALWISSTSGVTYPADIIVDRNYFHDCEWHACHLSINQGSFSRNTIRAVKESGLYMPKGGDQEARQIVIQGNTFDLIERRDVSGHAIESEAHNALITGNIMRNLAHGGIALTNVQNVTVANNIIMDCCQYGVTGWGAIDIVCNSTGSDAVKNIEIIGNRVVDTQSPQLTRHAVRLQGSGTAPTNLVIRHNHFADVTFVTSRYDFASLGGSVRVYDNTGDTVNSTQEFTQALTGDLTGLDTASVQEIFAAATDAVTVEAGVTYEFELRLRLVRSAGTTSHQTGLLFGGTCTISSMDYAGFSTTASGGSPATPVGFWGINRNYNQTVSTSTAADENIVLSARGIVRVTAAGTLIPQFQYSSAPGGAPLIKRGTLFRIRPIGSDTIGTTGPWA